jgi:hypothetical protein
MSHSFSLIVNSKHKYDELIKDVEEYFEVMPISKDKKNYYTIDNVRNLIINVMPRQIFFSQLSEEKFSENSIEDIKEYINTHFSGETISLYNYDKDELSELIHVKDDINVKFKYI